jgi:hypothetical protein
VGFVVCVWCVKKSDKIMIEKSFWLLCTDELEGEGER